MSNKFFNDAIIGNKNIRSTFSSTGELLRAYYPNVDFKQFVDLFHVGIKVNDSAIIYLHEDINNKYDQYYTEDTNILNTEIENTAAEKLVTEKSDVNDKKIIIRGTSQFKFHDQNFEQFMTVNNIGINDTYSYEPIGAEKSL